MNALTSRIGNVLAPTNYGDAQHFAKMLSDSDLVPKDYKNKPANVMVAMQWGSEIGLAPLQALQNIAVINGRPSIWGDAAIALARSHPACESIVEGVRGEGDQMTGWCKVKRAGEPEQERTFSMADAKTAGLVGKPGPWTQYPKRMLQLRARGFAIRDVFPDALRGLMTQEEAMDTPAEIMPPAAGPTIQGEARPAPPAPTPEFVMLAPDGTERIASTPAKWQLWCEQAAAKVDPEGITSWCTAMLPHIEAVREAGHDAAADAVMEAMRRAQAAASEGVGA